MDSPTTDMNLDTLSHCISEVTANRFNMGNMGKTLLVCMEKASKEFLVFGENDSVVIDRGSNKIETTSIWNLSDKDIRHDGDISFKEFSIPSYFISKYYMLFIRNSTQFGNIIIDGQSFLRPEIFIVKNHYDLENNSFLNNILFDTWFDNDSWGIRVFLQKLYNNDGFEKHIPLKNCLKNHLCPLYPASCE